MAAAALGWYQVMEDGSRIYITTTGDCSETMPTVGDWGGGGGGGGTYGGEGDSGNGGNGGWGGSGHSNGPTGNNNVQSFTLSTALIPCAKKTATDVITAAKADILNGGPIASLINMIGANSNIRVTITQGPIARKNGQRVAANATPTSLNNYLITLNDTTLLGNERISDLVIARNIIHEMLHVYMFDWADSHGFPTNAGLEAAMQKWFQYNQYFTNTEQHATMTNMVAFMGQSLSSYYYDTFNTNNRSFPISDIPINSRYFEDLCWQGLPRTGLSLSDMMRIGIVIKIENERFSGAINLAQGQNPINVAPAGSDVCQ